MTGKFGLRLYVVGAIEGLTLNNLRSTAWNEVRLEAQRIAREGVWESDTVFIPPSQIRSIGVYKKQ